MTTETTIEMFQAIDNAELADVSGGSYWKECLKGAATGFFSGLIAGPKGALGGAILGCIGGVAKEGIEKKL